MVLILFAETKDFKEIRTREVLQVYSKYCKLNIIIIEKVGRDRLNFKS